MMENIVDGNMSCESACRACLRVGGKLVAASEQYVEQTLEEFTGVQVPHGTGAPRRLCTWCASQLQRCLAFRARCRLAAELLDHLAAQHQFITLKHLQSIPTADLSHSISFTNPQIIDIPPFSPNLTPNPPSDSDDEPLHMKRLKIETETDFDIETVNFDFPKDEHEYKSDVDDGIHVEENKDFFQKVEIEVKEEKVKKKRVVKKGPRKETERKMRATVVEDHKWFGSRYNMEVTLLTIEEQRKELEARRLSHGFAESRYQCMQCYKGFDMEPAYSNHMLSHSAAKGDVPCDICNIRFQSRQKMKTHKLQRHILRFTCKQCHEVTKCASAAKQHFLWHEGQQFVCKECGKTYRKSTTYYSHVRIHHGGEPCALCGERFINTAGLNMHRRLAHKQSQCECGVTFSNIDALNRHKEGKIDGRCDHTVKPCVHCAENFTNDSLLNEHLAEKHSNTCDQFKKKRVPKKVPKKHMCEVCGYNTNNVVGFRDHQRIHTGETPFKCSLCPKQFRLKLLLSQHMVVHTGARPHQCALCSKAFTSLANMRRHENTVHTTERPFKCEWCGKAFKSRLMCKAHTDAVHLRLPQKPRTRNKVPRP